MTKSKAWIQAVRLRTLPLSLSGIILGSFIAKYNGYWDDLLFVLSLLTTVLFQILSNLANDLGDSLKGSDNAQRIGPIRSVQSGLISFKEMKIAIISCAVLSLFSAAFLIYFGSKNLPIELIYVYSALAIACITAAISYTIGKRAYGYSGLGDIMVFIFFGIVSVMGVYPLYTKTIDWMLILPASSIGLLSSAVLNLNNMRDVKNDANSGKRTLVVLMGSNLAKLYHSLLIIGALVCQMIYISSTGHVGAWIGILPGIILLFHVRKVMATRDPKEYDPELKKVALSTFGISVLTSIGLIFIK